MQRPGTKRCENFDWYDPEEECEWYRMHFYEMYTQLKPNQRREVEIEVSRQRKIEQLEGELQKTKKKVSVWKLTMCVFAIVISLVLPLK